MIQILLLSLAAQAAVPAPTDLDGDGKPESFSVVGGTVTVGKARLDCGMEEFICPVEVLDVDPSDKLKELVICDMEPRLEHACDLYVYSKGALTRLLPAGNEYGLSALKISTQGNGVLLVESYERLYTRLEKYSLNDSRTALVRTPQPFQYVNFDVKIDRVFPITYAPDGGSKVGTVRAGSNVTVLLESGDQPDHFLIRTSTGLVGWTDAATLQGASDMVGAIYGAG